MQVDVSDLQEGRFYLVEVNGWSMLNKITSGNWKIKVVRHPSYGLLASFYKPRGSKYITSHFLSEITLWYSHVNNNSIRLLGECDPKTGKLI